MEDIIDIIVTETTNLIEITSQPTDEVIDVNIIDNRENITLNVTPSVVEININQLTGNFGILWGEIEGTLSNQTDLQNALNLKADLVDGKVPSSQLPSYVDDVVEVANYASLPATGEVGKIYITLDTNFIYRWTGSTYVEIKDSSAVWGAITGTLSSQTDLQSALNLKANDNAVVHLSGSETITGAKTLTGGLTLGTSSGDNQTLLNLPASNQLIYREGVGSLYGFNIESGVDNSLFLTNSEGGYFQTLYFGDSTGGYNIFGISSSSNSGSSWSARFVINQNGYVGLNKNNPTEILDVAGNGLFSGSLTANTIVKSGGTSSQFLKADGSVDSSTYLTTSSAASTYLPLAGGTITGQIILKEASSSTDFTKGLRFPNDPFGGGSDTSGLRLYADTGVGVEAQVLELYVTNDNAGASIDRINLAAPTNDLVTVNGNKIWNAGNLTPQTQLNGTGFVKASGTTISYDNTSYLPLTGGTLTGTLNGTNITITNSLIAKGGTFNGGASYGGIVTIDGLGSDLLMNRANTSNGSSITLLTNAVEKWNIGLRSAGTTDNFFIYNSNLTANSLTINSSNSAATFASSVTATSHIVSGGTSSQFQKGDGSLDSNTYLTTSSASSTYLAKTGGTLTGALSGTSATFSGALRSNSEITTYNGTNFGYWGVDAGNSYVYLGTSSTGYALSFQTAGTQRLGISSSGAATFSSSVTADRILTAINVNNSTIVAGGIELQAYSINNSWIGENVYFDGTGFKARNTGYTSQIYFEANGGMAFKTSPSSVTAGSSSTASTKLYITSSGNVGIGTTAPNFKLSVVGATDSVIYAVGANNTYKAEMQVEGAGQFTGSLVAIPSGGSAYGGIPTSTIGITTSSTALVFATNNTERMRITSAGSVFIGKTTGSSKFGVSGLPTSSAGLSSGDFYQVAGAVMVVP